MSELWDKLKTELDKAGKAAQDVLDEGKLRIELFRVRQAADKSAESLGYAVYRARKEGGEPDAEAIAPIIKAMAEQEEEMNRLQAELKKVDGQQPAGAA
jgi:hypothetical protein